MVLTRADRQTDICWSGHPRVPHAWSPHFRWGSLFVSKKKLLGRLRWDLDHSNRTDEAVTLIESDFRLKHLLNFGARLSAPAEVGAPRVGHYTYDS